MNLNIHTDLINDSWLAYILEEFKRISGAKFDIQISKETGDKNQVNTIYYTKNYSKFSYIQRKDHIIPNNNFEWIRKDFFVLKDSMTNNNNSFLCYDVFWNSFIQLSRLEEWHSEKKGNLIHSYAFKHPRKDKTTFNIPIVNYYFEDLKRIITQTFPELTFEKQKNPIIEWTHDLDYIDKTIQLRLKQTLFNCYNLFKGIGNGKFKENLKKTIKFLFSNPSYWSFEYWEKLEAKFHIKSTFFIYSKIPEQKKGKNFLKSWLIDPSYDINSNLPLQKKLRELIHKGWEIGLHSSFFSAKNSNLFIKEKKNLEKNIGQSITKVRQHWLSFYENKTSKIHSENISIDYTIGWNDVSGYRSGCASSHHPYDHKNKKAYEHIVIPQLIMDSHIFDYGSNMTKTKKILQSFIELRNVNCSISWHPRTCSSDYNWHLEYENLLKFKHD